MVFCYYKYMYEVFLKPFWHDIKKFTLETLFPIHCAGCDAEGSYICTQCQNQLQPVPQVCIACKKPSLAGLTHPGCQTPLTADQLISVFDYNDKIINKLIIQGKYYFIPDIFKLFGELMVPRLLTGYPVLFQNPNASLVPLPLHVWRRRWRGFNQAEVLCRILAQNLNLKTESLLVRKRFTKTQKDLERAARQKNVAHAFALAPRKDLVPRQVVLVDDVTTTGFTLLEAAKVLKRNGAEKVTCLTIARD